MRKTGPESVRPSASGSPLVPGEAGAAPGVAGRAASATSAAVPSRRNDGRTQTTRKRLCHMYDGQAFETIHTHRRGYVAAIFPEWVLVFFDGDAEGAELAPEIWVRPMRRAA